MYPGNPGAGPRLTLEARKQLLLVACTIDRLDLVARWHRSVPRHSSFLFPSSPWLDAAINLAGRLLPRKLRLLHVFWRMWKRTRGS